MRTHLFVLWSLVCLAGGCAVGVPSLDTTTSLHQVHELADGRWTVRAFQGVAPIEPPPPRQVTLTSNDEIFQVAFREIFLRAPDTEAKWTELARNQCRDSSPPTMERMTLGPHEVRSVACRARGAEYRMQVDRLYYVSHPDGLLLEVAAFEAVDVQSTQVRRVLATLRPRDTGAPLAPNTEMGDLRLRLPEGYVTFRDRELHGSALVVQRVTSAGAEPSELRLTWSWNHPFSTLERPGTRETPWFVDARQGWVGRLYVGKTTEGAIAWDLTCRSGPAGGLSVYLAARTPADAEELTGILATLEIDHDEACTLAPQRGWTEPSRAGSVRGVLGMLAALLAIGAVVVFERVRVARRARR